MTTKSKPAAVAVKDRRKKRVKPAKPATADDVQDGGRRVVVIPGPGHNSGWGDITIHKIAT